MPQYRFNADKFRQAAAALGDKTGYAITQRTKLSGSAVSRIIRGERQPTFESAATLARTYGLSLDDLVSEAA